MNALFFTQGKSLDMFYGLMRSLKAKANLGKTGFFVADGHYYRQFLKRNREFEEQCVLKEWEIIESAVWKPVDLKRLREYERKLGAPNLMRALVADRRVYQGPFCTLRQDYAARFSHEQMMQILQEGFTRIEALFDAVKPDVVFSFICVTFGEYLAYLVARARRIPFLNLRPTRVENYVTFAPTIFEPSEFVKTEYERGSFEEADIAEVRRYLEKVRGGTAKYEGVLPVSRRPPAAKKIFDNFPHRIRQFCRDELDYHFGGLRRDNHVIEPVQLLLYRRLLNPMRARWVNFKLDRSYVREDRLSTLDYVFFPLHTEPEITLLVHSPGYLNQIETVRNLSQALPVGCHLLVKEHPASIGKRSVTYYRKLLQIPGVLLADPGLTSNKLVEKARLVANIAGSIGFEALIRKKPVLTFGSTPYEILPDSMVRRAGPPHRLADHVKRLLETHRHNENLLVRYVAATIRCSARANLYSSLLGREGVYAPGNKELSHDQELAALADLGLQALARDWPPVENVDSKVGNENEDTKAETR